METIEMVEDLIKELSDLCQSHLASENAIPGPSSFAHHDTWAFWQQKKTVILCFRPNGKQGLPLCVLHDVFRKFQVKATEALPSTLEAAQAMVRCIQPMPQHARSLRHRRRALTRVRSMPCTPLSPGYVGVNLGKSRGPTG